MAGFYGDLTADQQKRKAGRSRYWWKDRSGRWHYHVEGKTTTDELRPGGPPINKGGKNQETKPAKERKPGAVSTGATASGGRPVAVQGQTVATAAAIKDATGSDAVVPPKSKPMTSAGGFSHAEARKLANRLTGGTVPYNSKGSLTTTKSGGLKKKQSGSAPTKKSFSKSTQIKSAPKGDSPQKAVSGAPGGGRVWLHNMKGATKVYDKAASRLLKKKQKGYRP